MLLAAAQTVLLLVILKQRDENDASITARTADVYSKAAKAK